LPRLKCTFREFIAEIEAHGFTIIPGRQGGSHRQYKRVLGEQVWLVTVAYHNIGDEIRPDTLASMIRQSGLSKNLFRK
jgi:predicted RNA binding protein YcfA (HicA-like mRNA interferase family)